MYQKTAIYFYIHYHESPRYPTLLTIGHVITHYTVLNWSLKHITALRHYFIIPTDAHNYKIIGILKQLKFRLSLRHKINSI